MINPFYLILRLSGVSGYAWSQVAFTEADKAYYLDFDTGHQSIIYPQSKNFRFFAFPV